MLNCDYTGNTSYKFYYKCIIESEDINIVGEYPDNKIEKVLTCFTDTDKWTEFYLPEIVDIPIVKPDIEGIVEIHSQIEIISQRVIKTPVVNGDTGTFIISALKISTDMFTEFICSTSGFNTGISSVSETFICNQYGY